MRGFGFVSSPGLKQVDGMRRQMRGLWPRERTPKTGLKEAEDEGKFLLLVPDEEYCCSSSPVLMSFMPSVPFLGTGFLTSSSSMCLSPPHCSEKASWIRGR